MDKRSFSHGIADEIKQADFFLMKSNEYGRFRGFVTAVTFLLKLSAQPVDARRTVVPGNTDRWAVI